MTNELSVESIRELLGKVTQDDWEWANFINHNGTPIKSKQEISALLAESVEKCSGLYLKGVTVAGAETVICYTGNGPKSEDNSEFIAQSKTIVEFLLQKIEDLQEELLEVRTRE